MRAEYLGGELIDVFGGFLQDITFRDTLLDQAGETLLQELEMQIELVSEDGVEDGAHA